MRTFQRSDQWVLASQLFVQMKDADVLPDVVAYSAAISASASGAQWTEALTLCMELQAMKKRGLSADVICYNALIQACGEGQQWRLALWAFAEIQLNRLQPTQISFNTAISACSRCGEWQSALVLFDILSQLEGQHQIGVDALACNAVLSALEKHGLWKMGLDFLKKMQSQHKVQPDVITYNTLISSCGRRGNWQEALALLAALTHELQADEISFSAAISACGHGLHWLQSLQLLGQMEREDVAGVASGACAGRSVTGITAFGAAITACEELGLWEQSLLLLARAQAARAVNVVVLNAAISACGKVVEQVPALPVPALPVPALPVPLEDLPQILKSKEVNQILQQPAAKRTGQLIELVRIAAEEPQRFQVQRSCYTKLIRALGVGKRKMWREALWLLTTLGESCLGPLLSAPVCYSNSIAIGLPRICCVDR
eukprot:g2709.t1